MEGAFLAHLNADPSAAKLAGASGVNLNIVKYTDGSIIKTARMPFSGLSITTSHQSNFIIIAASTNILVYDETGVSMGTPILVHDVGNPVWSIAFDAKNARIAVVGSSFGIELVFGSSPSAT